MFFHLSKVSTCSFLFEQFDFFIDFESSKEITPEDLTKQVQIKNKKNKIKGSIGKIQQQETTQQLQNKDDNGEN